MKLAKYSNENVDIPTVDGKPAVIKGGMMIHLNDGRMLSVKRTQHGCVKKVMKQIEKAGAVLSAAIELFTADKSVSSALIIGQIVPDVAALDDPTRQTPFVGVVFNSGKLALFYKPQQIIKAVAPLGMAAMVGNKPKRSEKWLTEPLTATA